MKGIINIFVAVSFFPFSVFLKSLKSKKNIFQRILGILISIFVALPLWLVVLYIVIRLILIQLSFPVSPFQIKGDSMLPSLKNNEIVLTYPGKTMFKQYSPQRGDIVVFMDSKTLHNGSEADYVKRVIAVSGDTLRFDDGDVYLNGKQLNEPYVLTADSTWLPKVICETVKIPNGYVFLMGDNRVYSSDSRAFGFVAVKDIVSYLPLSAQEKYKMIWATTDKSTEFNNNDFIKSINERRKILNVPQLTENNLIDKAAEKRINIIFQSNDLSYTATKSGMTTGAELSNVGFNTYGKYLDLYLLDTHLNTQKLVNYFMENKNLKNYILNKDYSQIGIASNNGSLDNCGADIKYFILFGK